MMGKRILVVEDDPQYQLMVKASLEGEFIVSQATSGQEALDLIANQDFDLFVVDWMLGDADGLQICSFIKSQERLQNIPVIILTGKEGIENLAKGFDSGADDYVTKPFHIKELKLRVQARLRNSARNDVGRVFLRGLTIDNDKQRVFVEKTGAEIDLTRIEFRILQYLAAHVDHVLTRDQILDTVWPDNLNITQRTVDSHVSNLRKKIAPTDYTIFAVQGVGYRFSYLAEQTKVA